MQRRDLFRMTSAACGVMAAGGFSSWLAPAARAAQQNTGEALKITDVKTILTAAGQQPPRWSSRC
jgi:hypothetical protein